VRPRRRPCPAAGESCRVVACADNFLNGIASLGLFHKIAGPDRSGDGVQTKIGGPQRQTRSVISSTPDEASIVGWPCHLLDHSSAEQRAHNLPGSGDWQCRRVDQPVLVSGCECQHRLPCGRGLVRLVVHLGSPDSGTRPSGAATSVSPAGLNPDGAFAMDQLNNRCRAFPFTTIHALNGGKAKRIKRSFHCFCTLGEILGQ
jgi:hypothetical protein